MDVLRRHKCTHLSQIQMNSRSFNSIFARAWQITEHTRIHYLCTHENDMQADVPTSTDILISMIIGRPNDRFLD